METEAILTGYLGGIIIWHRPDTEKNTANDIVSIPKVRIFVQNIYYINSQLNINKVSFLYSYLLVHSHILAVSAEKSHLKRQEMQKLFLQGPLPVSLPA